MNRKIAPRVQLNFAPEEEIIDDSEIISDGEEPSLPVSMPEVIERKEIVENDIFDLKIKEHDEINISDEIDEQPPAPRKKKVSPAVQEKQVKPTKTGRKLSEEHAAKLALAREKALATRRANAEEKKRMKEIENKTKELKKKKAQKDLEQLEDEVDNNKPVKSTPSVNQQNVMFSKKDLEDAQLEAIIKYETIRKARKEEKKKKQLIDQQKEQLKQKIAGYGAKDTNGRLINRWDRCY